MHRLKHYRIQLLFIGFTEMLGVSCMPKLRSQLAYFSVCTVILKHDNKKKFCRKTSNNLADFNLCQYAWLLATIANSTKQASKAITENNLLMGAYKFTALVFAKPVKERNGKHNQV
jgi:hypothetical protein